MFVVAFLFVLVGMLNRMFRNAHHQPSVLHAFQANQQIRELGNLGRFAVHNQYFQAGFVVQMGVAC